MTKFIIFTTILLILIINFAVAENSKNIYVVKNSKELYNSLILSKNGDEIILKFGIYYGNFEVKKSIKIFSKENAIINSNNKGSNLRIHASNTKVKGIKFNSSGKKFTTKDSCIFIEKTAEKTIIKNNNLSNCGFGIWIDGSNKNLINKNIFFGTKNKIISNRGNNIHIFNNKKTMINNNYILQGRDGIYISNSKKVIIKNNKIIKTRFGIHYMYNNKCNIISNKIIKSLVGTAIMYSNLVKILNNFIYKNKDHGIFLRNVYYSKIINNKSIYNQDGIFVGGSSFNNIIKNKFIKNKTAVKISITENTDIAYWNNFIENKTQVKFINDIPIIWSGNKHGNYWSHYIGIDNNKDNIGDTIFYVTNISDWLSNNFPILKIIIKSPAMEMLQKFENQFPAIRKSALIDKYPLMTPIK